MKKNMIHIISATALALSVSSVAHAQSVADSAGKTSDLYRNSLQTQLDREVDLRDSKAGVGTYLDQNMISGGGNTISLGVEGAYKVLDQVTIGGSLQAPLNTKLPGAYSAEGTKGPSLGLYTKYQENEDGTGLNTKLSGAYGQQKLGVHSGDQIGQTRLYGYAIQAQTGYGFDHHGLLVTPYMGVSYSNMRQNSFASQDIKVGKFSEERTSMQFGVKADYRIDQIFKVDADAGLHANLSTNRHGFNAIYDSEKYSYSVGDDKAQPYINVGVTADIDNKSSVRLSGGANQQSYDNTAGVVDLSYQYRF